MSANVNKEVAERLRQLRHNLRTTSETMHYALGRVADALERNPNDPLNQRARAETAAKTISHMATWEICAPIAKDLIACAEKLTKEGP